METEHKLLSNLMMTGLKRSEKGGGKQWEEGCLEEKERWRDVMIKGNRLEEQDDEAKVMKCDG